MNFVVPSSITKCATGISSHDAHFYALFLSSIFRMPHKCHGNANNCPTRSQPIWELPINELDRREDPSFDERLSGCHLVSSCSNVYDPSQFRTLLEHNFNRYEYRSWVCECLWSRLFLRYDSSKK